MCCSRSRHPPSHGGALHPLLALLLLPAVNRNPLSGLQWAWRRYNSHPQHHPSANHTTLRANTTVHLSQLLPFPPFRFPACWPNNVGQAQCTAGTTTDSGGILDLRHNLPPSRKETSEHRSCTIKDCIIWSLSTVEAWAWPVPLTFSALRLMRTAWRRTTRDDIAMCT